MDNEQTPPKIKVVIGGRETELSPDELASKFNEVNKSNEDLTSRVEVIRRNEALLRSVSQNPSEAIRMIHDAAQQRGIKVTLPGVKPGDQQDQNSEEGDETDTDMDDNNELLSTVDALKAEIQELKLRQSMNSNIDAATQDGTNPDELKRFMVDNSIGDPAIAARLMKAEAVQAEQTAAAEAAAEAGKESQAILDQQAELEAMFSSGEGVSGFQLAQSGQSSAPTTDDGRLDRNAHLAQVMAANGMPLN